MACERDEDESFLAGDGMDGIERGPLRMFRRDCGPQIEAADRGPVVALADEVSWVRRDVRIGLFVPRRLATLILKTPTSLKHAFTVPDKSPAVWLAKSHDWIVTGPAGLPGRLLLAKDIAVPTVSRTAVVTLMLASVRFMAMPFMGSFAGCRRTDAMYSGPRPRERRCHALECSRPKDADETGRHVHTSGLGILPCQ